jgi:hypothetical protein
LNEAGAVRRGEASSDPVIAGALAVILFPFLALEGLHIPPEWVLLKLTDAPGHLPPRFVGQVLNE